MNISYLFYIPAIALFALIAACAKESPTIVNGTVVDKCTGKLLKGVSINVHIRPEYLFYTTLITDDQGKFSFSGEGSKDFYFGQIRKGGYLFIEKAMEELFDNYQRGKTNEGVIQMIPLDGILNLKVENLAGVHDTIFLEIYSPLLESEIGISDGEVFPPIEKLSLLPDQHYSQDIPLASNQEVTIYWDFKPINHSTANKGNTSIMKNDTVFYTISY